MHSIWLQLGQVIPAVEAYDLEELTNTSLFWIAFGFLLFVLLMAGIFILGWWMTSRAGTKSLYTGQEMRRGEDLAYSAMDKVQKYLDSYGDPSNPAFDVRYAAICSKTGRIFPDSLTIFGIIKLDWSFLQKRHRGSWVSWGSLSSEQQAIMTQCHDSLEGYQTEESCKEKLPKNVDIYFGTLKPGPLYVDLATRTVLGWKEVPETNLEVLVVQRPARAPKQATDTTDTIG